MAVSRLSSESLEGTTLTTIPPRGPLWRGESEVGHACHQARPGPPQSRSGWVLGGGAWHHRLGHRLPCPELRQQLRCLIREASQSVTSSNDCSCVAEVGSAPHILGTSSNPEESSSSSDTCKQSNLRKLANKTHLKPHTCMRL